MKRFFLLFFIVSISVLSTTALAATQYSDVTSSHWAYKPVMTMTQKKIVNGYPDGSFKPSQFITRAEFAKILVNTLNLAGEKANTTSFNDVPETHWAHDYIKVASKYLTGYQNNKSFLYFPDSAAVREDMALAIVAALGLEDKGYQLSTLGKFSDSDLISESLQKYVAIAAENGLMNGNADGTFNPKGSLTRAEVCQLMQNALDSLEKVPVSSTTSTPKPTSTPDTSMATTTTDTSTEMKANLFYVKRIIGGVTETGEEMVAEPVVGMVETKNGSNFLKADQNIDVLLTVPNGISKAEYKWNNGKATTQTQTDFAIKVPKFTKGDRNQLTLKVTDKKGNSKSYDYEIIDATVLTFDYQISIVTKGARKEENKTLIDLTCLTDARPAGSAQIVDGVNIPENLLETSEIAAGQYAIVGRSKPGVAERIFVVDNTFTTKEKKEKFNMTGNYYCDDIKSYGWAMIFEGKMAEPESAVSDLMNKNKDKITYIIDGKQGKLEDLNTKTAVIYFVEKASKIYGFCSTK